MDAQPFLAATRQRLRFVIALEGSARLIASLIAVAIVLIALDRWLFLPGWLRLCGLIALIALVGGVALRRLLRPLSRAMDDRTIAQLAERRLPGLDGRLISRVEGLDLGARDHAVLAERLSPAATVALVPGRRLPRTLALAALALLLAATAGLLLSRVLPGLIGDGLARLFLPLGSTQWQRSTELTLDLERSVIAADERAVILVRRTRGAAAPLHLAWRPLSGSGSGEARQLPAADQWRQAIALTPGRYEIRVESGDAEVCSRVVTVINRPELRRVNALITPPAYTGLKPEPTTTLKLSALAGSRVDFALDFRTDAGQQITRSSVVVPGADGPRSIELTANKDGSLGGTFIVAASGVIAVDAADAQGIGPHPALRFALTMTPDQPPVIDLSGPRSGEAVSAKARVGLTVQGQDDLGLAKLSLHSEIQSAPGADGRQPPPSSAATLSSWPDVRGMTAASRPGSIDVGSLARIGQNILVVGRGEDANDVSGPGRGASSVLSLRVVSDDELRQDLDRLIADAKERTARAREELATGLNDAKRLSAAARGAAQAGERAGDVLAQLERRWRDNQLPAEAIAPARSARALLAGEAASKLAEAGRGAIDPARLADRALAEAERLLASLIQDGDLGRRLAQIIAKQKALNEATDLLLRDALANPRADLTARAEDLALRQAENAAAMRGIEQAVLAQGSATLDPAKALLRKNPPADRLDLAGERLRSPRRGEAAAPQAEALDAMLKLQELLRGDAAARELSERVGELAWRQEQLGKALDQGQRPQELSKEQERLREETKQLQRELTQDPEAAKLGEAAEKTQEKAQDEMQKGDRAGASADSAAAAGLLRALQRKLAGDQPPPDDGKKSEQGKKTEKVLGILKEMLKVQANVVADATLLDAKTGMTLDFAAQRAVRDLAAIESDLGLRTTEEVLKLLEQFPIGQIAAKRIAASLKRAEDRFAQPALGEPGVALARIALADIARMIEIIENLPQSDQAEDSKGGPSGPSGQDQESAFPPAAELALLAAMQQEVAAATLADRRIDLAAAQAAVRDLVELAEKHARPGSRPALLLARARRAAASAAELLGTRDRGLTTRHEQVVAELHLRQILAEAKGSGGGGGGGGSGDQGQRPQRKPGQQQPSPGGQDPSPGQPGGQQGSQQGGQQGGAAAGAAAGAAGTGNQGGPTAVDSAQERGEFLHLPPEQRERLRNELQLLASPKAQQLFRRYVELLQEGAP